MSRISSRQLYDNRDLITQILNLKDEIADQAIDNIAFTRSGSVVTLTVTLGDGTAKTANFTEKTISTIASSQIGDVVTLKFNFNDGTVQSVSFHVSGGGTAPNYYAGNGILKTGTASSGYTFEIDESITATKASVDSAVTRIEQCESDLLVLKPRVDNLDTDLGVLGGRVTATESDIDTIENTIGTDTTAGTLKGRIRALEDWKPGIDTTTFSNDNSHVPGSKLVNDKKLDKPTTTPTVGQLLAAGATGPEWVNPTPGAVIDTAMSDTSENAVQNKVIKAYVDDVDDRVDAVEDEIGPETTAGTLRYSIKQNADAITDINTTIGSDILTPKTGMFKLIDDNDQAAVHKTGDETIQNAKTFTGRINLNNIYNGVLLRRVFSNLTWGDATHPGTNPEGRIFDVMDSANRVFMNFQIQYTGEKTFSVVMGLMKSDGIWKYVTLADNS